MSSISAPLRQWFGASQVVDVRGNPLVAYHGTRRAFTVPEPMYPRGAIGNPKGIYFSSSRSVAEEFAQDVDGALDEKSRIMAAYLYIASDADGRIIQHDYDREFIVFQAKHVRIIPAQCLRFDPACQDWQAETPPRVEEDAPAP